MRRAGWTVAALLVLVSGAGCRKGEPRVTQTVNVQLTENGFVPAEATVHENRPVALVVTRTSPKACGEVQLPDSGIRRDLAVGQPVTIEFTPRQAGQVEYACGTGEFQGRVVVESGI